MYLPGETFSLGLESSHGRKNLDITCRFDDVSAATELKRFCKFSKRAQDLDMYGVWVDITRLNGLDDIEVKRFSCLTDHEKYTNGKHGGYSVTFSIAHGAEYKSNTKAMMFVPLRGLVSGKTNQETKLSPSQKTLLLIGWKRTGGFISC